MTDNVVGFDGGKKNGRREISVMWQCGNEEDPRTTHFAGENIVFSYTPMENYLVIAKVDEKGDDDEIIATFPTHVLYAVRDTTETGVES